MTIKLTALLSNSPFKLTALLFIRAVSLTDLSYLLGGMLKVY